MATAAAPPIDPRGTSVTYLSAHPDLYRNTQLVPTIQKKRQFVAPPAFAASVGMPIFQGPQDTLPLLERRSGNCDPQCMAGVTRWHAAQQCKPLLDADPSSRTGAYLDCINNQITAGWNACGCGAERSVYASDCDPDCKYSTGDLVTKTCLDSVKEFPSDVAFQACERRMRALGEEGCGCIKPEYRLDGYSF